MAPFPPQPLVQDRRITVRAQIPANAQNDDHVLQVPPSEQRWSLLAHGFTLPDPSLTIATEPLGQIQRFQGRYLEAEKNYREAINVWTGAFGAKHPVVGKGLMNLAAFYHEREREAGAEDLYRKALAILDVSYGKAHPLTLVARNELGDVLRAEHRYSESERLSQETMVPLEKLLGETDPRVRRARENYRRIAEESRVLAKRSRTQDGPR